jgi:hypothetical protein
MRCVGVDGRMQEECYILRDKVRLMEETRRIFSIERSGLKHKLDQGERSLQQERDRNAKLMVTCPTYNIPSEVEMTCLPSSSAPTADADHSVVRLQEEKRDLENQIALSRLSTEDLTEAVRNTHLPSSFELLCCQSAERWCWRLRS